jgi:hypothetical protein
VGFYHYVFGLHLHSNGYIPGLVALPPTPKVDVEVWLDLMPPWLQEIPNTKKQIWFVSDYQVECGEPLLRVQQLLGGAYFQISYFDGTEFIVDRAGSQIWAKWSDKLTLEDTATYLLGPVFGLVLRLRGIVCLHASSIQVGDKCMAIVGHAGAGKSTTAAAFAKAGFPILSDDVLPLWERDRTFLVQAGYPRVRLWPKSVEILYGTEDALPCLTPNWDKRYLDLTQEGYQFQQQPLPLGAIYILGSRSSDAAAPFIESLPAPASIIKLIANTYSNGLLDKGMRAKEFDLLSRLVAKVPVRQVTPHADAIYLPKLCEVIIKDFESLNYSALTLKDAES